MTNASPIEISAMLATLVAGTRLIAFDFDGVFTDNSVYVFDDGSEAVRCSRADGLGLRKLEAAGLQTVVISTETNPIVGVRCRKLGIRYVQGCSDKLAALEAVLAETGLSLHQAAFVGNDLNDLACLSRVGLPIIVQDAYPEVVPVAYYQTRRCGGNGAVREVCDLFESILCVSNSHEKLA
jgi:3-deoxy-D-manno-octulosonate 8-phosphate phosphatase (KDO 8-P phosphatase)